jgi:hypothetical protein
MIVGRKERGSMGSRLLAKVMAQAEVLVPLLNAFRAEIGVERANRIAWRALSEARRAKRSVNAPTVKGGPRERWDQFTSAVDGDWIGDALEVEVKVDSPDVLEYDVTSCQFAQFFRTLGEPELGFVLVCAGDYDLVEDVGRGEISLERSGTLMQGGPRCDFRYAFRQTS